MTQPHERIYTNSCDVTATDRHDRTNRRTVATDVATGLKNGSKT